MIRQIALCILAATLALPVTAQTTINLGNNSSEWARDGECDDPRFVGDGMAVDLDDTDIRRDAADCRALLEAGRIRPVRTQAQSSPQECANIRFGNDSNDYAYDGECDDPRFTGSGMAELLLGEDRGTDASDCRKLCRAGQVWLR